MADGGGLGDFLALFSAEIISVCCFLQSLPREFKCWLVNVLSMIFLYCSASVPSIRCSATSNTARFLLFCLEQTYVWKCHKKETWNWCIVYVKSNIMEFYCYFNLPLHVWKYDRKQMSCCKLYTEILIKKIKPYNIKQYLTWIKAICLNMFMRDIYLY